MDRDHPGGIGPLGLLARLVFPLLLVYATWNPWGRSFYHWALAPALDGNPVFTPGIAVAALVLIAGWVVVVQATRRSLGFGGTLLVAGIVTALAWLLIDRGVFRPSGTAGFAHVGLVALGLLLAVGMNWAFVSRRLTGTVEVDTED